MTFCSSIRSGSSRVGIVNLGLGNLGSVQRMLERVGAPWICVNSREEFINCRALILPGVGHFDEGMRVLRGSAMDEAIKEFVSEGGSVLGICLGMQLLTRCSEEGSARGLGLVDAEVQGFRLGRDKSLKIPHMGWNVVNPRFENPLIPVVKEEQRFYFVHSYCVVPIDRTIEIATSDYGGEFCAAFQKDNIFGVQFHPEKSHRFGFALMKRFFEFIDC